MQIFPYKLDFVLCLGTFCLISSSIVLIPIKEILYLIGFLLLFVWSVTLYRQPHVDSFYFVLFVLLCWLSSIINNSFNYRLIAFTLVVITVSPIIYSNKLFIFREKYLYHCLMLFPFLSIASLMCYYLGINAYQSQSDNWDFSAFFPHPMWLAAAVGLANVVLMWLILQTKSVLLRLVFILLLVMSIWLSVISASRVALVASLFSMLFELFVNAKNIRKAILYCLVTLSISLFSLPFYVKSSTRIQAKHEYGKNLEYGSRTLIFESGFNHFVKEPVFGSGFAVSYVGNKKIEGKLESGSGWLSILFQTGVCGFIAVLILMCRAYRIVRYISKDPKLRLFLGAFCFLCLHSCFEGYILTSGYYLCILFWMLLGYIITYPSFYMKKQIAWRILLASIMR